jgi:hypothetical protein
MVIDEQHCFHWNTGVSVCLIEFPGLLTLFQQRVAGTADVERDAKLLCQNGFPLPELESFIRKVCHWGGYSGVAQRVINKNLPEFLTSQFCAANEKVRAGNVTAGLEYLLQVNQLSVSFASKHLKFLAPDQAVVLESIISKALFSEKPNVRTYEIFLTDCRAVQQRIIAGRLDYTGWATNGWRVSDVEMAIFAKLKLKANV